MCVIHPFQGEGTFFIIVTLINMWLRLHSHLRHLAEMQVEHVKERLRSRFFFKTMLTNVQKQNERRPPVLKSGLCCFINPFIHLDLPTVLVALQQRHLCTPVIITTATRGRCNLIVNTFYKILLLLIPQVVYFLLLFHILLLIQILCFIQHLIIL